MQVVRSGSGEGFTADKLGYFAEKRGVYIHHCDGMILYVGKTTEGNFNFFKRLYRQFVQGPANNSRLFQLLAQQTKPVYTYFLELIDVDMMVNLGSMSLNPEDKALIMELALIGIYKPVGNGRQLADDAAAEQGTAPDRP
jgi:hypothetical protein